MATYCFNLAAILAVSVTLVIWRHQANENCGHTNHREIRRVAHPYFSNLCPKSSLVHAVQL